MSPDTALTEGARVLIAEPSVHMSSALKKFLRGPHFQVSVVQIVDEAVHRVRDGEVDLLLTSASSTFDGEALCAKVKRLAPQCPVVLMYPPDEEDPTERAAKVGADACLVGPIKRGTLLSTALTMLRIRDLLRTVEKLEADLRKRIAQPPRDALHAEDSSADFAFFKKFLLMEVKRSRRYKYPVSFLVVAVDRFAERLAGTAPGARMAVQTEVLAAITRGVRDIDLAVPFTDNRFLVFLPHTPREGALRVASRLHDKVTKVKAFDGLTASIGVSSFDAPASKEAVSFGSLVKEATDALRKAQLAGGNRVEAGERKSKRDRISIG